MRRGGSGYNRMFASATSRCSPTVLHCPHPFAIAHHSAKADPSAIEAAPQPRAARGDRQRRPVRHNWKRPWRDPWGPHPVPTNLTRHNYTA